MTPQEHQTFINCCLKTEITELGPYLNAIRPETRTAMIQHNSFKVLKTLAAKGENDRLEQLLSYCHVREKNAFISGDDYQIMHEIAENGDSAMLDLLYAQMSDENKAGLLCALDYEIFRIALEQETSTLFESLWEKARTQFSVHEQQDIFLANDAAIFNKALRSKSTLVPFIFSTVTPETKKQLLSSYTDLSMANGELLQLLFHEARALQDPKTGNTIIDGMIAYDNYAAFRYAMIDNHIDIAQIIYDAASSGHQIAMIDMHQEELLSTAKQINLSQTLNFLQAALLSQPSPELSEVGFLKFLWDKLTQEQKNTMFLSDNYELFTHAAAQGNSQALQLLYEKAPAEQKKIMLLSQTDKAFKLAIEKGYDETVAFLWHCVQEQLTFEEAQDFLRSGHCDVLITAVKNNQRSILEMLVAHATPETLRAFLSENHYASFTHAAAMGSLLCLEFLWVMAQSHDRENPESHLCHDLISGGIYQAFSQAIAHGHRDTTEFIYAHLPPETQQFLLSEHYVDFIGQRETDPQRFAPLEEFFQQNMSQELRAFLELRRAEVPQPGELQKEALNDESSDIPLTPSEQAQLGDAQSFYHDRIGTKQQVQKVIEELRETLITRYLKDPAIVQQPDGSKLVLPLSYEELQTLLSDESLSKNQQAIFEAYYQNKNHTAYRYFLDDNKWLDPYAIHGVVNEKNTKRTFFKENEDLIALAFVAVTDEKIQGITGATWEDRLDFFISQLSDIARAHNRDRTGVANYDDLRADNPSCRFGITRRLYQSVLDHPLFIPLIDLLEAQIVEQMKNHFQKKINPRNHQALLKAWQDCVEYPSSESLAVLQQLNPTETELEDIARQVKLNLKELFSKAPRLLDYIETQDFSNMMKYKLHLPKEIGCYALKFASQTNLERLLKQYLQNAPTTFLARENSPYSQEPPTSPHNKKL